MTTDTIAKPATAQLKRYLYHIDGIGRQVWSKYAPSEKVAHAQVWNDLTDDEKDRVVIFDWIDTEDAKTEPAISWREHRFSSIDFVRCPTNCARDIGCPQCSFWGTVPKGSADAKCAHDYHTAGAITQTLRTYQCIKCGDIRTVDSSG